MGERLPLIYVRGYAGPQRGIDKAVDDPFYGFNAGSTHVRTGGDGAPRFYQFESPLLRLITDEAYDILVQGDQHAYLRSRPSAAEVAESARVPAASLWVYRFYDPAASTFGDEEPVEFDIEEAAAGLYDFVQLVRDRTGADKVYLVAHSMGGLVCRCMIQKVSRQPGRTPGRDLVDKLFTFATPHGGIDARRGLGVVDWVVSSFGPAGSDIFAPAKMRRFLEPDGAADGDYDPRDLDPEVFDPDRVFCLIGTNAKDYGLVEKVIGPKSDGLVLIDRAYVRRAHRAFVHRSHSGRFGIVNSEEGYQNLRRFLFGSVKVKIGLVGLDLPPAAPGTREVWQADLRLSVRGLPIVMHEQQSAHHCPIQLNAEQHQPRDSPDTPVPVATVFLLDQRRFLHDPLAEPPLRCRYALQLRVFRLRERDGFFSWRDHLEQIADWEDTLIVDVGTRDADPPGSTDLYAWAAWNSTIPVANAERDPIAAPDEATFVGEGAVTVPLPDAAKQVLGEEAGLRLATSPW